MADQIDAFTGALQAHLQPLLDDFMNLEVWARICIGDLEGDDEHIREILAEQLPGFDVNWVTVDGSDFTGTWTPKCTLVLCTEIKGEEVRVDVDVTKSTITAVKLSNKELPASLDGVDLVHEFGKWQTYLVLSK
jgi:hypothetical protein